MLQLAANVAPTKLSAALWATPLTPAGNADNPSWGESSTSSTSVPTARIAQLSRPSARDHPTAPRRLCPLLLSRTARCTVRKTSFSYALCTSVAPKPTSAFDFQVPNRNLAPSLFPLRGSNGRGTCRASYESALPPLNFANKHFLCGQSLSELPNTQLLSLSLDRKKNLVPAPK